MNQEVLETAGTKRLLMKLILGPHNEKMGFLEFIFNRQIKGIRARGIQRTKYFDSVCTHKIKHFGILWLLTSLVIWHLDDDYDDDDDDAVS